MDWLRVLLLAIIQGLTEFLPVSSSGHLVIVGAWLDADGLDPATAVALAVALHLGTLGAVLVMYAPHVLRMLTTQRRVLGLVAVGSLPAAAIGLYLRLEMEQALASPLLAGIMLPVTGVLLLWAGRQTPGETAYPQMSYRQALLIGVAQAAALLPGLSRSGTTIVAGLAVGLRREAAATFSFLLSIPAILGAGALELAHLRHQPSALPVGAALLGGVVALLVGLLALKWLLDWLHRGRLQWFAYWCIPLGLAVVAWQLGQLAG